MKQCKNCKAHLSIDPKMTRCPRCQSDLRHWVDRHPFLTVFVFIIAIILFVNRGGGDKKKTAINPTPVKQEKTEVTVVPVSGELTNLLEYSMAVGFIFKAAGEASTARADQLEKYPNWNKIDSDLFYMAGNIIESAYESLTKLTPPKILGSVHQKALKGLGLWKQSVSTTN